MRSAARGQCVQMPGSAKLSRLLAYRQRAAFACYVCGEVTTRTSHYKHLGAHLTNYLSWVLHIQNIATYIYGPLGSPRRKLKPDPPNIKKLPYQTADCPISV